MGDPRDSRVANVWALEGPATSESAKRIGADLNVLRGPVRTYLPGLAVPDRNPGRHRFAGRDRFVENTRRGGGAVTSHDGHECSFPRHLSTSVQRPQQRNDLEPSELEPERRLARSVGDSAAGLLRTSAVIEDGNSARRRMQKSAEELQRGRLVGSVRTAESNDLTGVAARFNSSIALVGPSAGETNRLEGETRHDWNLTDATTRGRGPSEPCARVRLRVHAGNVYSISERPSPVPAAPVRRA